MKSRTRATCAMRQNMNISGEAITITPRSHLYPRQELIRNINSRDRNQADQELHIYLAEYTTELLYQKMMLKFILRKKKQRCA